MNRPGQRSTGRRTTIVVTAMAAMTLLLAVGCLFIGSVNIPPSEIMNICLGGEASKATWNYIIADIRIPAIVTAALSGAALGIAGLLLQTTFNNPLAGPSILGVSTGASFGVALTLLAGFGGGTAVGAAAMVGSTAGALVIILVLLALSSVVRSSMMLLIVGILLSYLTSSGISILNFFATQEGVHSFVIWGLGSFAGVSLDTIGLFSVTVLVCLFLSLLLVKPLNALLLGERYAASLGINVSSSRTLILLVSGVLTAIVTSFCGPVSFIGLAVPHIARLSLNTSDHRRLLPATMLAGAATGLLTLLVSTGFTDNGSLPVNAVTPIIGVPVVLYIILNRRRLNYFN